MRHFGWDHCRYFLSVTLACTAPLAAQSYFQPTVTFPAGKSSGAIVAVDFNHDGKPDVAVLDPTSAQVDVLLGDGKGNLGSPATFAVGTNPTNLIAADFNGDGFPDLVVTDNNGVEVLLGNGNGTFAIPLLVTALPSGSWISSVDLNGDGKLDLVILSMDGMSVNSSLGNGDGTFQSPINSALSLADFLNPAPPPSGLILIDLTQDGKPDLVYSDGFELQVQAGSGDGTFAPGSPSLPGPINSLLVAIGDLDGDKLPDLVESGGFDNGIDSYGFVSVILGNITQTGMYLYGEVSLTPVVVADFTGDSVNDVLNAGQVLPGLGNGNFGCPWEDPGSHISAARAGFYCPVSIPWPPNSSAFAYADFNGDGALDFVASVNGQVSLLNTISLPKPVLTGPGTMDFGSVVVGSPSSLSQVNVTNNGLVPAIIKSMTVSGTNASDFVASDFCDDQTGLSIKGPFARPGSCVIPINFTPSGPGNRSALLTVDYLLEVQPLTISLTGTGLAPLSSSPSALSFGNFPINLGPSTVQTLTIMNVSLSPVTIGSIALTGSQAGDFAQSNSCQASLAANGTCTISVQFVPTAVGARSATLTLTYGKSANTITVGLSGTGVSDAIKLVASASTSATISSGQTANYTLSVGGNGYSGTASLSCSGLPQPFSCTVPTTQALNATTASTFTVSVKTAALEKIASSQSGAVWFWTTPLLAVILLTGLRKPKTIPVRSSKLLLTGFSLLLCFSCGGGTTPPPPSLAGTYHFTVQATAPPASADSINLTLVVQ
jgi:hypothetical protein